MPSSVLLAAHKAASPTTSPSMMRWANRFDACTASGALAGDLGGQCHDGSEQALVGHHVVDQAVLLGLGCGDVAAGEQQFHRHLLGHRVDDPERAASCREQSALDWEAERRVDSAAIARSAARTSSAPPPSAVPLTAAITGVLTGWLTTPGKAPLQPLMIRRSDVLASRQRLEVRTRAERLVTRTGEDDGLGPRGRRRQPAGRAPTRRSPLLIALRASGLVDRQDAHVSGALDEDGAALSVSLICPSCIQLGYRVDEFGEVGPDAHRATTSTAPGCEAPSFTGRYTTSGRWW